MRVTASDATDSDIKYEGTPSARAAAPAGMWDIEGGKSNLA